MKSGKFLLRRFFHAEVFFYALSSLGLIGPAFERCLPRQPQRRRLPSPRAHRAEHQPRALARARSFTSTAKAVPISSRTASRAASATAFAATIGEWSLRAARTIW